MFGLGFEERISEGIDWLEVRAEAGYLLDILGSGLNMPTLELKSRVTVEKFAATFISEEFVSGLNLDTIKIDEQRSTAASDRKPLAFTFQLTSEDESLYPDTPWLKLVIKPRFNQLY